MSAAEAPDSTTGTIAGPVTDYQAADRAGDLRGRWPPRNYKLRAGAPPRPGGVNRGQGPPPREGVTDAPRKAVTHEARGRCSNESAPRPQSISATETSHFIGSRAMGLSHIALFVTLDLVGRTPGGPDEDAVDFPFGGRQAPPAAGQTSPGPAPRCVQISPARGARSGPVRAHQGRREPEPGPAAPARETLRSSRPLGASERAPVLGSKCARTLKACTACMQRMPCIGIHPLQVTHASRALHANDALHARPALPCEQALQAVRAEHCGLAMRSVHASHAKQGMHAVHALRVTRSLHNVRRVHEAHAVLHVQTVQGTSAPHDVHDTHFLH